MPSEEQISKTAFIPDRVDLLEELYKKLAKQLPAYATVTANYTQPNPGTQVEIFMAATDWLVVNQLIQVWDPDTGRGGFYEVKVVNEGDDDTEPSVLAELQAYTVLTSGAGVVIPVGARISISSGQPDFNFILNEYRQGQIQSYTITPSAAVNWVTITFAANTSVQVQMVITCGEVGFNRVREYMVTKAEGLDVFADNMENYHSGVDEAEQIGVTWESDENSITFKLSGTEYGEVGDTTELEYPVTTERTVRTRFLMNSVSNLVTYRISGGIVYDYSDEPPLVPETIEVYRPLRFSKLSEMLAYDYSKVQPYWPVDCDGLEVSRDQKFGASCFWDPDSEEDADNFNIFQPTTVSGAGRLVRSLIGSPLTIASGGDDFVVADEIDIGEYGACLVAASMHGTNHALSYLFAVVTTSGNGVAVATLASSIYSANGSIAVAAATIEVNKAIKLTFTRNPAASTAAMACKYKVTPLHNRLSLV